MAITVNYEWPVAVPGSTTPASSSQKPPTNPTSSVPYNDVVALLTGDGSSTTVTITHNLELTAAELAQQWPEVDFEPLIPSGPAPWIIAKAANTVTIGFVGTTLSAFRLVRIRRPLSESR
jgi:hypothetical protein